jgi:hypothetical protein
MSRVEERLGEMEVTLPNLPTPRANYVPENEPGIWCSAPSKFLLSRDEHTKANSVPP